MFLDLPSWIWPLLYQILLGLGSSTKVLTESTAIFFTYLLSSTFEEHYFRRNVPIMISNWMYQSYKWKYFTSEEYLILDLFLELFIKSQEQQIVKDRDMSLLFNGKWICQFIAKASRI